jgi:hypothetical protein
MVPVMHLYARYAQNEYIYIYIYIGKDIPVTGHGGP